MTTETMLSYLLLQICVQRYESCIDRIPNLPATATAESAVDQCREKRQSCITGKDVEGFPTQFRDTFKNLDGVRFCGDPGLLSENCIQRGGAR